MHHRNRIVLASVLAGSLGLAALGIARAQTSGDIELPSTASVTTADSTVTTPGVGREFHVRGRMFTDQAKQYGMTVDELQTQLQAGTSMYQIAAEHGVTYEKVRQQKLSELQTRLGDMVKVGYMTQQQADDVYSSMESNPMLGMENGGHHPF